MGTDENESTNRNIFFIVFHLYPKILYTARLSAIWMTKIDLRVFMRWRQQISIFYQANISRHLTITRTPKKPYQIRLLRNKIDFTEH